MFTSHQLVGTWFGKSLLKHNASYVKLIQDVNDYHGNYINSNLRLKNLVCACACVCVCMHVCNG